MIRLPIRPPVLLAGAVVLALAHGPLAPEGSAQGAAAAAGRPAEQAATPADIRVRGGNHGDYGRIVFDWSKPVRYELERFGDTLYLSFARPAKFEFFSVFPALDEYVGQPAPGPHGYRITIPMKGRFDVKDWTYGTKVVVDLYKVAAPEAPSKPPRVRVEAAERPTFGRITFHWPRPVGYELTQDEKAGTASLRFRRPARFDFTGYSARKPSQVLSLAPVVASDRSGVDLKVPEGARVEVLEEGPAIALKVLAAARAAEAPASVPTVTEQPSGAGAGAAADQPLKLDPETAAAGVDASERKGDAAQGTAGNVPEPVVSARLPEPKPETGAAKAGAGGSENGSEKTGEGDAPLEVLPDAKPQLAEAGQEAAAPDPERRYTPAMVARGIVPAPGEVPPPVQAAEVDLPWAKRTAAAFARAGELWLALGGRAPDGVAAEIEAALPDVTGVTRAEKDGATLLRMTGGPNLRARPELSGGVWRAVLSREPALPARPMEVRVEDGRLVLPVEATGPVMTMADPATGQPLAVVPVAAPGHGVAVERDFPELTLLATHTGVAVLAKADGVRVRTEPGQVVIEGGDSPLAVSPETAAPVRERRLAAQAGGGLLDLQGWRRPGMTFTDAKQDLNRKLGEAAPSKKPLARLELARFNFAHGLGVEALGHLDLYQQNAPRRARDPQVLVMRAGSQMLAGEWTRAAETLNDPALDGVVAALPWQAAYASLTGAHEAAAAGFHKAEAMMAAYPSSVRKQLRLWAARSRIALGDLAGAEVDLDTVRALDPTQAEAAQVAFLEGRRQLAAGEPEAAEARWREAAASTHPPSRAQARFILAERALADGDADVPATIAELERLRYAWRGDAFEGVLLHRLADLYVEEARYGRALSALKQAASHLPDSPLAQRAAARMRTLFTKLFLDGAADRMPPLKALALYESFRELTPAGDRGDEMIARLADRLVGVDLLGRAAKLLEAQVRHRLAGTDKADVGTRLAAIRLLDRAPEAALEALDLSQADDLPEPLAAKRTLLRARALAETGRPDEALGLLAGRDSRPALELAAEIHAEQGDWTKAVAVLDRLLPEPPADGQLDPVDAQQVMRTAVAMTLSGQTDRLRQLSDDYGTAMAASAHAETFDLLDPSTGGGPVTVAKQLAEVQTAKTFMNAFRDRLKRESGRGSAAE